MPNAPPRILAVNPGWRYLGTAAFRGPELLDWGVKVVTGRTPSGKLASARGIVLRAIQRYDIDVLAIKRLHRSRSSAGLRGLTSRIKEPCRRKGLKVCQYSIQDLKAALLPDRRTNKRTLAESLTIMYPVLAHDLRREGQNKNVYHLRMFEAVALGVVCHQQLTDQYK
jgi:hypothetical protein